MKKVLIISLLVMSLCGVTLYFVLQRSIIERIELSNNAEILLDGEATLLWDCHKQSYVNDGAYVYVCNSLTTDYVIYPCIFISSTSSDMGKCK